MKDQFPLLLALSPLIGFLITLVAVRSSGGLVRHLAGSNALCTLLLFGCVFWQFQSERSDELVRREEWAIEAAESGAGKNAVEVVNSRMEREHAERLAQRWFVIDGINLWPVLLLVVTTGCALWQVEVSEVDQNGIFPLALLFEAIALAALMAYDLRVFLLVSGAGILVMAVMLGRWGGPDRREITVRFVVAQFSGLALVALGFAMLVVAVPWMKIEDSRTIPPVLWNIAPMMYEIRKWTSGNPLAFQYENEVFPSIVLVLSLGLGIQCGLFPFHGWLVALLSRVPISISVMFVSGWSTVSCVAWLRFVMPLSPDVLLLSESSAAFSWLILIPAVGGSIWGAARALVPAGARRQLAYLFLSLSGLALLGAFSFSRVALSGMWLMQQQLFVTYCAASMAISPDRFLNKKLTGLKETELAEFGSRPTTPVSSPLVVGRRIPIRLLLIMTSFPLVGFFASGSVIVLELLRVSLSLVLVMLLVAPMILWTLDSLLKESIQARTPAESAYWISLSAAIMLGLAAGVNLIPQTIVSAFEPEFVRVFQKFEPPVEDPASKPDAVERQ